VTVTAKPRGRGRPSIGERVEFTCPADELAQIDRLAARHEIPRAEAIRALIAIGLAHSDVP
jgi:hypothetical protein